VMEVCGLDLAQLSGDEAPELLDELDGRAFKALRPVDEKSLLADIERYPYHDSAPAWLIDACLPGAYGGTGRSADRCLAAELARMAPILLAGGLQPENVVEAIQQVQPWGVDVASGVETRPGYKDHAKMAAFIHHAKTAL
jgi:phosphoribosylanthranilate isomerase